MASFPPFPSKSLAFPLQTAAPIRRKPRPQAPEYLYFFSLKCVHNPLKKRQKYPKTPYMSSSLDRGLYGPRRRTRRFSSACRTAPNRRTKFNMHKQKKNTPLTANLPPAFSTF